MLKKLRDIENLFECRGRRAKKKYPKQTKGGDPMSSENKAVWCARGFLTKVPEQPSPLA